jgi:hypothetical protein
VSLHIWGKIIQNLKIIPEFLTEFKNKICQNFKISQGNVINYFLLDDFYLTDLIINLKLGKKLANIFTIATVNPKNCCGLYIIWHPVKAHNNS